MMKFLPFGYVFPLIICWFYTPGSGSGTLPEAIDFKKTQGTGTGTGTVPYRYYIAFLDGKSDSTIKAELRYATCLGWGGGEGGGGDGERPLTAVWLAGGGTWGFGLSSPAVASFRWLYLELYQHLLTNLASKKFVPAKKASILAKQIRVILFGSSWSV
jgi:hypothetical protein